MTRHPRFFPVVLVLCVVALSGIVLDAARLRRVRETAALDVTRVLGLSDLALSSTARWLRHPSQAEPAAATADQPYALDVEPAGGVLLPPPALDGATRRLHGVGR